MSLGHFLDHFFEEKVTIFDALNPLKIDIFEKNRAKNFFFSFQPKHGILAFLRIYGMVLLKPQLY